MVDLITVVGATASGKTEFGLRLANELPIEIINADALQAYREFEIGTAKPSPEERARVPHHLIDILNPDEGFSAGEFARRARRAIEEITRRGRVPVVVGGSGFYLQALIDGLAPIPSIPGEIRERLQQELEQDGLSALRSRLKKVDPKLAGSLSPEDSQRTLRALAVYEATGRQLSKWQRLPPTEQPLRACWLGLTMSRQLLYDQISVRTQQMLRSGWLAEVRELRSKYGADAAAFQAIGYRTLVAVLDGRLTEDEAEVVIARETRRYAKRQLTWFRRNSRIVWFDASDMAAAIDAYGEANA